MSKTPADITIWIDADDPTSVVCIDQRLIPFEYQEVAIRTSSEMATVIADMVVRGAGCIGVSAGYGMYLAALGTDIVGVPFDVDPVDPEEELLAAARQNDSQRRLF